MSISLIHNIASEGETSTSTCVLNLIFQHEKVENVREALRSDQPCNSVDTLLLLERENFIVDGLLANLGVGIVSLDFVLHFWLQVFPCLAAPGPRLQH